MKKLIVLTGENCGYCKKAKMLIRRVLEKDPRLLDVDIRFVLDNSPEGQRLSHTLVPAFFCNGICVFEGNPDIDTIMAILVSCYSA